MFSIFFCKYLLIIQALFIFYSYLIAIIIIQKQKEQITTALSID